VYNEAIHVKPGLTEITWNGSGASDGTYTASVLLYDGIETITKEAKVTIDTSKYTYERNHLKYHWGVLGIIGIPDIPRRDE